MSTPPLLIGIALLAVLNVAFKAAGPVLLSGRPLPPLAECLLQALGQCLLASLVATTLLGAAWDAFDPTVLPGLALALALRFARRPALLCALSAVALTGLIRLVT